MNEPGELSGNPVPIRHRPDVNGGPASSLAANASNPKVNDHVPMAAHEVSTKISIAPWSAAICASLLLHLVAVAAVAFVNPKATVQLARGGAPMEVELIAGTVASIASDVRKGEKTPDVAKDTSKPPQKIEPTKSLPLQDPPIRIAVALPPPSSVLDQVIKREARKLQERRLAAEKIRAEQKRKEETERAARIKKAAEQKATEKRRIEQARLKALEEQRRAREHRRQEQKKAKLAAARKNSIERRKREKIRLAKKLAEARARARQNRKQRKKLAAIKRRKQEDAKRRKIAALTGVHNSRGRSTRRSAAASRGGTGGRTRTAGRASRSSHKASVLAHLARYKRYPNSARSREITGGVIVAFSLSAKGSVRRLSVSRSSGSKLLDNAAISMVRRAAPFPSGPAPLRIRTAIVYNLR